MQTLTFAQVSEHGLNRGDPLSALIGALQMNGHMDMNRGSGMMGTGMTLFMVLVAILVVLGIIALLRSLSHGTR